MDLENGQRIHGNPLAPEFKIGDDYHAENMDVFSHAKIKHAMEFVNGINTHNRNSASLRGLKDELEFRQLMSMSSVNYHFPEFFATNKPDFTLNILKEDEKEASYATENSTYRSIPSTYPSMRLQFQGNRLLLRLVYSHPSSELTGASMYRIFRFEAEVQDDQLTFGGDVRESRIVVMRVDDEEVSKWILNTEKDDFHIPEKLQLTCRSEFTPLPDSDKNNWAINLIDDQQKVLWKAKLNAIGVGNPELIIEYNELSREGTVDFVFAELMHVLPLSEKTVDVYQQVTEKDIIPVAKVIYPPRIRKKK